LRISGGNRDVTVMIILLYQGLFCRVFPDIGESGAFVAIGRGLTEPTGSSGIQRS
jgi:hypothetical protein